MSSEWRTYSLDEVGRIVTGKTPKSGVPAYEGSDVPFVSPSDFTGNKWIMKATRSISEAGALSVKGSMVPARSVLVTCIGSDMGRAAMAASRCVTNQQINSVLVDEERFCPEFLYYNLSLRKAEIRGLAGGSAQPILNKSAFGRIIFEAPQLDEQRQISAALRPIDDRITLLRETNTTLEAIAQALFKSWFVDFDPVRAKAEGRQPEGIDAATAAMFPDSFEDSELGQIPKGWRVVRLADVTERITKGTTPTTLKRPFVQSGINFVKVESIADDGQLLPDKFAYIDDETHRLLGRSQLKAGDVLITIAGTIGRVSVITEDFIPANTNQAVAIVRPDASKLPSSYVNQFLRLADSKFRMGERVVQAVQANLSLGSLSQMRLVMPPPELVKRLHDLVFDCVESKKNSIQKSIRTLTQLRDALLPRLISGQMLLPEAESLLENDR